MKKILSIIIPMYNEENHIIRMVESVESQEYKDYDLILVNDGSTDNTLNIINDLKKKYKNIKVIDKENTGRGLSRNAGLELVKTKYVTFLDADDYVSNDYFEKLIPEIKKNNFELLVFNGNILNNNEITNYMILNKFKDEIIDSTNGIKLYLNGKFSHRIGNGPCNKIYRKDIIDKYDMKFTKKKKGQDLVFNVLYVSKIKKIKYINYKLYNYDLNFDIVKSNFYRKDAIDNILEFYEYFEEISLDNNIKNYISLIGLFYLRKIPEVVFNEVNNDNYQTAKLNFKKFLNNEKIKLSLKNVSIFKMDFKLLISYFLYRFKLYYVLLYIYYKKKKV